MRAPVADTPSPIPNESWTFSAARAPWQRFVGRFPATLAGPIAVSVAAGAVTIRGR